MTDQSQPAVRVNAELLAACIQLRGALILDHMVDDNGKVFGTTQVALDEAGPIIAKAMSQIPTCSRTAVHHINAKLLAAAKAYVSKTDDPAMYHHKPRYDPRCGCGDCGVRTYEKLLDAIADAEKTQSNQEKK